MGLITLLENVFKHLLLLQSSHWTKHYIPHHTDRHRSSQKVVANCELRVGRTSAIQGTSKYPEDRRAMLCNAMRRKIQYNQDYQSIFRP